jgi:hypothetical protein
MINNHPVEGTKNIRSDIDIDTDHILGSIVTEGIGGQIPENETNPQIGVIDSRDMTLTTDRGQGIGTNHGESVMTGGGLFHGTDAETRAVTTIGHTKDDPGVRAVATARRKIIGDVGTILKSHLESVDRTIPMMKTDAMVAIPGEERVTETT